MMEFDVIEDGGPRHENVLATPRLIDEGTRPGHPLFGPRVEAYQESTYQGREVWRVRDDTYDPPGTQYVRVRVEVAYR
jgi:hypothetical protein